MRMASLSITVGAADQDGFLELTAPVVTSTVYVPGFGPLVVDDCISEELLKQIEAAVIAKAEMQIGFPAPADKNT